MSNSRDSKILLAAESQKALHWAEALTRSGHSVWRCRSDVPSGQEPEVLLTDSADGPAEGLSDLGIVRVGADGPADVNLPADCTPREVCLACGLLAQVVRLRRRERAASKLHQELFAAALTDPLTGLPNRRAWDATVAERLAQAATSPWRLCLAILDLDHFKRVNDVHGHGVGDAVLREAGQTLLDGLRHEDFVARLGGDEFGLLLWVPDEEAAARVIDRVRTALPARVAEAAKVSATASAGYAIAPSDMKCECLSGTPPGAAVFAAADAALCEAKRSGRNRTVAAPGP